MMTLKFLKSGDFVDIISPGTACTLDESKEIENFVEELGLTPRFFLKKELTLKKAATHEFPSFSAEQRFEQFRKAINSDSKIIWCARGGYGSAEILPLLRKTQKPKNKKIFIGFSDISSLNKILIENWGWSVVSAPMLAQIALNKVSAQSVKAVTDFIFGKTKSLKYELVQANKISISNQEAAIVTGGCISVLAGDFGTKNQIDWHNKILFLEDEGESGERLDRYFRQVTDIILEQKKYPQAIVLGNFLESNPHGSPKAKNVMLSVTRFANRLTEKNISIPLLQEKSKSLGHSKNMLPLVLGKPAQIKVGNIINLVQKI